MWTQVSDSISYNGNHYTKHALNKQQIYRQKQCSFIVSYIVSPTRNKATQVYTLATWLI